MICFALARILGVELVVYAYGRDMVHVRFVDHCRHRMLNTPILELEVRVLVPDSLQVKVRSIHVFLQKGQVASMRYGFS